MVTPTSQDAPIHHAAEIHRPVRSTHESEDGIIQSLSGTGRPATAASGSCEQATSPTRTARCEHASPKRQRLRGDADGSVPAAATGSGPTASYVQYHVRPSGGASTLSNASCTVSADDGYDADPAGADALWAATGKPTCTGDGSGKSAKSVDDGPTAERDTTHAPTCCQPFGSQCTDSITTKPGLLSPAGRNGGGHDAWKFKTEDQPSRRSRGQ